MYFSEDGKRERFVGQILEAFATLLQKAKKVFVKPNIVSYEPYPTTNHPEVLEAVLSGFRMLDAEELSALLNWL